MSFSHCCGNSSDFQPSRGSTSALSKTFALRASPISEQSRLLTDAEVALQAIDTLTAEAERAIGWLQERRTALISAAVTGKIDVRGISDCAAER